MTLTLDTASPTSPHPLATVTVQAEGPTLQTDYDALIAWQDKPWVGGANEVYEFAIGQMQTIHHKCKIDLAFVFQLWLKRLIHCINPLSIISFIN